MRLNFAMLKLYCSLCLLILTMVGADPSTSFAATCQANQTYIATQYYPVQNACSGGTWEHICTADQASCQADAALWFDAWVCPEACYYEVTGLTLNASPPGAQLTGNQVTFTAQGNGAGPGDSFYFQFQTSKNQADAWIATGNNSDSSSWTWTTPPVTGALYDYYRVGVSAVTKSKYAAIGGFGPANQNNLVTSDYFVVKQLSFFLRPGTLLNFATVNEPYNEIISVIGNNSGTLLRWNISTGTLPSGLTLNPSTGQISGTPIQTGIFNFSVNVTGDTNNYNETKQFVLKVVPPLVISNPTLPIGNLNTQYSQPLSVSGGLAPYNWTLSSGILPQGLRLDPATGTISGVPTSSGSFPFTVKITHEEDYIENGISFNPSISWLEDYTLTISDSIPGMTQSAAAALSITTTSLPYANYNVQYPNTQMTATGGTPPYSWTTLSGHGPPTGMSLSPGGVLSGLETNSATSSYVIGIDFKVTDSLNATAIKTIYLTELAPVAWYSNYYINTFPDGYIGTAYTPITLTAKGGAGGYVWSIDSGNFPPGLTLSSAGVISGTPTQEGVYTFTLRVGDSQNLPLVSGTKTMTITVFYPAPIINTSTITNGQFGVAFNQPLAVSSGKAPYTWSIWDSSPLPSGLRIDSSTGAISGIPSDIGRFDVWVGVTDSQAQPKTTWQEYKFNITNGPMQLIAEFPTVVCNEANVNRVVGSTASILTGVVKQNQELFSIKGAAGPNIDISLFYQSLSTYNGPLGLGWTHSYNIFLSGNGDGSLTMQDGNGYKSFYPTNGINYDLNVYTYASPPGDFSTLVVNSDYTITVTYRDGHRYNFDTYGRITSIVDRFSNTTSIGYDASGDMTSITDPAQRTVIIAYDQSYTPHRISSITDPNHKAYDFSYVGTNCSNSLCRVTNPVADPAVSPVRGYWEYQYNSDGTMKSKSDPNSNLSQYTYYSDKRMWQAIDPEGAVTPTGHTRTMVYPTNNDNLRTTTLTEKDGGPWLYTYDAQNGVIMAKTDPNGKVTNFYYYPNGFIKAKTEPKDGNSRVSTFYKYDSYGNLALETEPTDLSTYNPVIDPNAVTDPATLANLTVPIKAARHYIYDNNNFDRVTSASDERGAVTLTTSFAYSTEGSGEVVTATTTPGNFVTVIKKYPNGTVKQIIDANLKSTTFGYYPVTGLLWTIVDPAGVTTTITGYDNNGNVSGVKITDKNGADVPVNNTMIYDALNRLTSVSKKSGKVTPAFPDIITTYGYDLVGNLTTLIDAETHTTTRQYNYNGQVTKTTDAKLNDTVFTYSGSGCSSCGAGVDKLIGVYDANVTKKTPLESQPHNAYVYDQLGRLDTETDPLGKIFHYTYYDNGLVKEKYDATSAMPGTLLLTLFYNNRGQITDKTFSDGTYEHYTYTANGLLETATNQNISYTYEYYDNGRLLTVTDTTNSRVISYDQYDGLGQRQQVTILKGAGADERVISYDYDSANRPWHITSSAGAFTYNYDNLGRRWTLGYPNSTQAEWNYDDLNRLTTINHTYSGGASFAVFNYSLYDRVDNRKSVTGNRNESYIYDELYRLLTVTSIKPENFVYDAAGNRQSGPTITDTAYQANLANQLTQGTRLNYGYDNAGNQKTKAVPGAPDKTWTRTWDYNNRVTQEQKVKGTESRTISYKYDPFGRRIEKKFVQIVDGVSETQTTTYVYDNADVVLEIFATDSSTEKTYITHGPRVDEHLALERIINGTSSFYYYHADGLGSIVSVTQADTSNPTAAAVQSYDYSSYGMATASTDFRNSYQFQGREYDWETGTYYFRNRIYDPIDGIFVGKDPITNAGGFNLYQFVDSVGKPLSIETNLYAYAGNNPVNNTDPLGLFTVSLNSNLNLSILDISLSGGASLNFGYDRTKGFSASFTGSKAVGMGAGFGGGVEASITGTSAKSVDELNGCGKQHTATRGVFSTSAVSGSTYTGGSFGLTLNPRAIPGTKKSIYTYSTDTSAIIQYSNGGFDWLVH